MHLLERSLYFLHGHTHFSLPHGGPNHLSACILMNLKLAGKLEPHSQFLINIRQIDSIASSIAIPLLDKFPFYPNPNPLLRSLFADLSNAFKPLLLLGLHLRQNPFCSCSLASDAKGDSMLMIHRRYEFSASHQLYNPELSSEQNEAIFGKCANPQGHGHNYEFEVSIALPTDASPPFKLLDPLVQHRILRDFDHKNLNTQVPEFNNSIPTVENIAKVLYERLAPDFPTQIGILSKVKVWETPKTAAEYSLGPIDMHKY